MCDVCAMAGVFCSHSSDCIGILNLSGFYLPSTSFGDDRAIQNAIYKIKNCPDFFASECIDLIRQAADWSISFAAGSDARKSAFLKDVSQGCLSRKRQGNGKEKESGVFEMYYIELATGLRRGELLGLKWSDIDLEHGSLRVQRQIARIDGEIVEAPLKTKNAYRTLPLSADAIDVLKTQEKKCGNSQYVFPSPTGGPISPDSVLHMLHRVLKRAGLPKVRFHDLRHSYAVAAIRAGDDIKTVQETLGHATAAFTLDVYGHVTNQMKQASAERMDAYIKNVSEM